MNVKHFRVRVSGDHLQNDQNTINQFLNGVTVIKTATNFITGLIDYWSVLVFYEIKNQDTTKSVDKEKISVANYQDLSEDEKSILMSLKEWRNDKAAKMSLPHYMICHNSELMTIAKLKPESVEDLKKIKGFGDHKISRYGNDIISLLSAV